MQKKACIILFLLASTLIIGITPLPLAESATVRVQGYAVAKYSDLDVPWTDTPTETNSTGLCTTNATMTNTPTIGNTLIACGGILDKAKSNTLHTINQTGVVWQKVNSTVKTDYATRFIGCEIWKGYVTGPTVDSNIVFNFTVNSQYTDGGGVPSNTGWYNQTSMQFDVSEYSGLPEDCIDQSVTNTGTGNPQATTGTTQNTTYPAELWIGTVSFIEVSAGASTPQNGFTLVDSGAPDSFHPAVVYLEKIVSAQGEASTGVTLPANYDYAACIATFISKPPPTYTALTASSTAANSTCTFGITVNDDQGLESNGQIEFGTNNTGAWVWASAVNFTATPQTLQVNQTLNSTIGTTVSYMWNFTNNQGIANTTGIQTLTTTGYEITVSNDSYSTVEPSTTVYVCWGGSQTYNFSAISEEYTIQTVIINGTTTASTTSPLTLSDITGNTTLAISTSNTTYTVTSSAGEGATIYPSGSRIIPYGTWANYTCSANGGFTLDNFYINGTAAGLSALTSNQYNFIPTGNTTLHISALAVSGGGAGGGGGGEDPAVTPQATTTSLSRAATGTSPNNFLFLVGIVAIFVFGVTIVYSRNVTKKAKKQIQSWNT